MAERQIEHRKSYFVLSPLAFPSSTVAKSAYCFKYREEPIPYLDQATRKNTCQIILPKNIPESKISNPKNPSLRSMAVLLSRAEERRSREIRARERAAKPREKLLPPQSPRGFSALARLYYLARPTKTAMLRRLKKSRHLKSGVATPLGNYLSNAWVTCGMVFHTGYPRTSKGSKHQFLGNVQDGLVDAPSFALCHRIYLPRNFSYYDVRRCRVSSRLPTQTTPNLRCIRG